jgi:hypothetical protein
MKPSQLKLRCLWKWHLHHRNNLKSHNENGFCTLALYDGDYQLHALAALPQWKWLPVPIWLRLGDLKLILDLESNRWVPVPLTNRIPQLSVQPVILQTELCQLTNTRMCRQTEMYGSYIRCMGILASFNTNIFTELVITVGIVLLLGKLSIISRVFRIFILYPFFPFLYPFPTFIFLSLSPVFFCRPI